MPKHISSISNSFLHSIIPITNDTVGVFYLQGYGSTDIFNPVFTTWNIESDSIATETLLPPYIVSKNTHRQLNIQPLSNSKIMLFSLDNIGELSSTVVHYSENVISSQTILHNAVEELYQTLVTRDKELIICYKNASDASNQCSIWQLSETTSRSSLLLEITLPTSNAGSHIEQMKIEYFDQTFFIVTLTKAIDSPSQNINIYLKRLNEDSFQHYENIVYIQGASTLQTRVILPKKDLVICHDHFVPFFYDPTASINHSTSDNSGIWRARCLELSKDYWSNTKLYEAPVRLLGENVGTSDELSPWVFSPTQSLYHLSEDSDHTATSSLCRGQLYTAAISYYNKEEIQNVTTKLFTPSDLYKAVDISWESPVQMHADISLDMLMLDNKLCTFFNMVGADSIAYTCHQIIVSPKKMQYVLVQQRDGSIALKYPDPEVNAQTNTRTSVDNINDDVRANASAISPEAAEEMHIPHSVVDDINEDVSTNNASAISPEYLHFTSFGNAMELGATCFFVAVTSSLVWLSV